MIQLKILSGKKAGTALVARRFPVRVGRSPESDLRVEDDGVWNRHFEVLLNPSRGFILRAEAGALTTVNRETAREVLLRNGDSIEAGSLRLQFWLGETRQRGLEPREWFTWCLIAAISLVQVALVYWLSA
jgi:pSer/pThr/pTyr-binding forkhead associated (FHA) protein